MPTPKPKQGEPTGSAPADFKATLYLYQNGGIDSTRDNAYDPPMSYNYPYPRPSLTVDCVVFLRIPQAPDRVLLIQRANDPFKGLWALPGGFVDENEPLQAAARRELKEETGLDTDALTQLHTFGDPGRDPRGHTVSVVYKTILTTQPPVHADDDASAAEWFPTSQLPPLAFDHAEILNYAMQHTVK